MCNLSTFPNLFIECHKEKDYKIPSLTQLVVQIDSFVTLLQVPCSLEMRWGRQVSSVKLKTSCNLCTEKLVHSPVKQWFL